MPMIEAKVTSSLPAEKRDVLKAEFGKAISLMNKPESYLMINLQDNQDLYFGGKKLDKGAYVEVKVLGSVDSGASSKMTAKVCEILDKELGIPGDAVYVSYFGTSNWGWNGSNFYEVLIQKQRQKKGGVAPARTKPSRFLVCAVCEFSDIAPCAFSDCRTFRFQPEIILSSVARCKIWRAG